MLRLSINYTCTQASSCICAVQSAYTFKGSSTGLPAVQGATQCEQYKCQDLVSTCEARTLCEADPVCRGFIFTKGDNQIQRVVSIPFSA